MNRRFWIKLIAGSIITFAAIMFVFSAGGCSKNNKPAPQPQPQISNKLVVKAGALYYRSKKVVKPKSIDWSVQPVSFEQFKQTVIKDAQRGVTLYVDYGGLWGKPLRVHSNKIPEHIEVALIKRLSFMNQHGIAGMIGCGFVDQGILRHGQTALWVGLRSFLIRAIERNGLAVGVLVLSEYDEHRKGKEVGLWIAEKVVSRFGTEIPVGLHPSNNRTSVHASCNLIVQQGWRGIGIIAEHRNRFSGKAFLVAEDQSAARDAKLSKQRWQACKQIGALYTATGYNYLPFPYSGDMTDLM